MATALFINGIFDTVLEKIIAAQDKLGGGKFFLQPHSGSVVRILRERPPSTKAPVRLYVSTTANLSKVCYTAEILGWEDKRELSDSRLRKVSRYLQHHQPNEARDLYRVTKKGKRAVNLITIRNLRALDTLYPTSLLTKRSDGQPLRRRTRSGGWSEVIDVGDFLDLPTQIRERTDAELASAIRASARLSDAVLAQRLRTASKMPERVQVISVGFRRNADVIVAVLRRAKGICEKCRQKAPFLRRSDGSPFLEIHHWTPLGQGGDDTVENAAALCPNCHRKAHHG